MIIKLLIQVIFGIIKAVFSILPNLPSIPNSVITSINNVVNIIFSNTGLLPLFVRISTMKDIVNILVIVIAFKELYGIIMWIIKKLPLSID